MKVKNEERVKDDIKNRTKARRANRWTKKASDAISEISGDSVIKMAAEKITLDQLIDVKKDLERNDETSVLVPMRLFRVELNSMTESPKYRLRSVEVKFNRSMVDDINKRILKLNAKLYPPTEESRRLYKELMEEEIY